jgi:hypothetical protein
LFPVSDPSLFLFRAAGDKTTFLPLGMQVGEMALSSKLNNQANGWMMASLTQQQAAAAAATPIATK